MVAKLKALKFLLKYWNKEAFVKVGVITSSGFLGAGKYESFINRGCEG